MTRNDLYKQVSKSVGIKQDDVKEVGNAIFDLIKNVVSTGEKVSIINFGVFEPKTYEPQRFFNPLKKEYDNLPVRTVPKFSASQSFRDECQV